MLLTNVFGVVSKGNFISFEIFKFVKCRSNLSQYSTFYELLTQFGVKDILKFTLCEISSVNFLAWTESLLSRADIIRLFLILVSFDQVFTGGFTSNLAKTRRRQNFNFTSGKHPSFLKIGYSDACYTLCCPNMRK